MQPNLIIKPHSLATDALEALNSTLKMLPNGGELERDETGTISVTEDGRVRARVGSPGFAAFAIRNQGYAATAEEL